MLSVGVATVLTYLIRGRKLSTLGWGWGAAKYQWMSYLIPLVVASAVYAIIWGLDLGSFYNSEFVLEKKAEYNLMDWSDARLILFHLALTATYSFLLVLPSCLGEEIAWRGFLVPELAKFMSFSSVAISSGLLWAVWHWPLMFAGIYAAEAIPLIYQITFFTIGIMSYSVVMTYLRYKTNSLWSGVIFHGSLNVFVQKVFEPLTVTTPSSAWYMGEFGIVPAAVALLVAIYFWRKGKAEFA